MPNEQAVAPIIFLLTNSGVPIDLVIFSANATIKPQNINISRNARGSVFNTATAAFLNDFNEGIPTLEISGNTGFGSEYGKGFLDFKNLELLFIAYLEARRTSSTPDNVLLTYIDTINVEAFNCYPMKFSLNRNARSPHLYHYNISLVILTDILEQAIFPLTSLIPSGTLRNVLQTVISGIEGLGSAFSSSSTIVK